MKDTSTRSAARVLVLCCEDRLGSALKDMLDRQGHAVSCDTCSADALDTVRAAAPDVVVIEARMQDGTGLALCQGIRQCTEMNTRKVLILQDQGRDIDRRRATALGADGFLAMPFAMDAFCDEVDRLSRAR